MAYGPPAKKQKTESDEETKRREQDRYSNGMEFFVIEKKYPLRYLRQYERKLMYLIHDYCRCKPWGVWAEHKHATFPILLAA